MKISLYELKNIEQIEQYNNDTKFKSIYWVPKNTFLHIYYKIRMHILEKMQSKLNDYDLTAEIYKETLNNLLFKMLMFFNYIKCYPTQNEFSEKWKKDPKTVKKYIKQIVVIFIDYFEENPISPESRFTQNPLEIHTIDQSLTGEPLKSTKIIYSVIDTSFFEISKPSGHENEKKYYSGKHKKHGVKVQTIVNISTGKICYLSRNVFNGSIHDIQIARDSKIVCDIEKDCQFKLIPNERILGDLGYSGASHVFYCSNKRGGGQNSENLNELEKYLCNFLSKHRIIVENLYGKVKTALQILNTKYRGDLNDFEDIIFTIFNICNIVFEFNPLRNNSHEEINNLNLDLKNNCKAFNEQDEQPLNHQIQNEQQQLNQQIQDEQQQQQQQLNVHEIDEHN